MGKRYGHVTIEERCEIACLQAEGRVESGFRWNDGSRLE